MGEQKGGIERLEGELYSRAGMRPRPDRRPLSGSGESDVAQSWSDPAPRAPAGTVRRSGVNLFLWSSVAFFILSAGFASFLIFGGTNLISTENIDIAVDGPASVAGGDELVLNVGILNKNTVPIELADLIVEYPPGTRAAENINLDLRRTRESVGTIGAGERVRATVRARLFGEENREQEIKFTVEYRVKGSNAIFYKEQVYRIGLSSAPLSVTVEALRKVVSGEAIDLVVTVSSNATSVVPDVLLKTEYPFGFAVTGSEPLSSFGKDTFVVGDLPPSGKRTVRIHGTLTGEDGDERVFRFSAGTRSASEENNIAAAFAVTTYPVAIERPFLALALSMNGDSAPEYVAAAGRQIRADVTWVNNLPTQVFDPEFTVRLAGTALDTRSVTAERGFYRSSDRTLTWSKETDPALAVLEPGASGRLSFTFSPLPVSGGASLRSPKIDIAVSARGRRLSDAQVSETITSSAARTVKIAADLALSSRATYASGPFKNTGPIPPKADRPTTYTVTWSLTNAFNPVDDVVVRATVPSYVSWLGVVSTAGERVSFNPLGGEVVWSVGSLPVGGGVREVSFQVSLTPSVSHIGSAPALLSAQTVTGNDQFTNAIVSATRPELTTDLKTEAGFSRESAIVIP